MNGSQASNNYLNCPTVKINYNDKSRYSSVSF